MTGAIVPVGHYLGLVHADGVALHRVRVGHRSRTLDTADAAAVWFTAHSFADVPQQTVWTRQRILDALPDPAGAAGALPELIDAGLVAAVDDAFADRFRMVPLTYGIGWRYGETGLTVGTGERAVIVDETVLSVWERGADLPSLRAACVDAAPDAADAALTATLAALHRLLAVSAVYVDVAARSR